MTLHTKLLSTDDEQHAVADRTPASVRGLLGEWQAWRDGGPAALSNTYSHESRREHEF
jgi:hypothetical protein